MEGPEGQRGWRRAEPAGGGSAWPCSVLGLVSGAGGATRGLGVPPPAGLGGKKEEEEEEEGAA